MKKLSLVLSCLLTLSLPAAAASPFTASEQAQVKAYKQQFQSVKNQAQLLATYRIALKLSKQLDPSLEKYAKPIYDSGRMPSDAELKAIGDQVPGLMPALVAEGTVLTLLPNYSVYKQAAARTPESADNAYFDLMHQGYGEVYHFFGNWFTQTWDYGGCTRLGQGTHTKLFQGIQKLRAAKNPFAPELKQLEDDLLHDLEHANNFCLPHAKAVAEYKQVLPLTPAAVRPKLQKRLQQIQSKAKDLGFDCDSPDSSCNYG